MAEGTVEIMENNNFVPFIKKAQFKFYLELVFPVVQVFDAQEMRSEFFKMRNIIHGIQYEETGIRAIRLETTYGIIQLTMLNVFSSLTLSFLPKIQAEKVIDEVMLRSQQQCQDQKKPYVLKIEQKNLPTEMDFQNQWDAEFAVQAEGPFKRLCGYVSVSVSTPQESHQKMKKKAPFLVFDSEYSGVFVAQLEQTTIYCFVDSENQFDVMVGEISVSLQMEPEPYQKFKACFKQQLAELFKDADDFKYLNDNVEQHDEPVMDLYQEEQEDVEQGPKFKRNVKQVEVRSKTAISSIDDIVFMYTGGVQSELLIRDAQKQNFSGRVKQDFDQQNLMASDEQRLLLFDSQKQLTAQELVHYVQGTQTVTTKFLDFSSSQGSVLGLQLSNAVVGISTNSLFVMDRRLENKKNSVHEAVQKSGNSYKLLIISKNGSAIIANQQGEVYIFNKQTQRAANKLPGTGFDPVGMCLSEDEEFLVVTFQTFVLTHQLNTAGGHFLEQQVKTEHRKPPLQCKLDLEEVVRLGLVKSGLKTAFVSRGFVVSGSGKHILVWRIEDLLAGKGKVMKKLVNSQVVGLGHQAGQCTIGFENGWGWFQE